jgi:hypothetical protein
MIAYQKLQVLFINQSHSLNVVNRGSILLLRIVPPLTQNDELLAKSLMTR